MARADAVLLLGATLLAPDLLAADAPMRSGERRIEEITQEEADAPGNRTAASRTVPRSIRPSVAP